MRQEALTYHVCSIQNINADCHLQVSSGGVPFHIYCLRAKSPQSAVADMFSTLSQGNAPCRNRTYTVMAQMPLSLPFGLKGNDARSRTRTYTPQGQEILSLPSLPIPSFGQFLFHFTSRHYLLWHTLFGRDARTRT